MFPSLTWVTSAHPNQLAPGAAVQLSDVVFFKVLEKNTIKKEVTLEMTTRDGFRIYKENLTFTYQPQGSLSYPVNYKPSPAAKEIMDPFEKKKKEVFESQTRFTIIAETDITPSDTLAIRAQGCSDGICLLPATLTVPIDPTRKPSAATSEPKFALSFEPQPDPKPTTAQLPAPAVKTTEPTFTSEKITTLSASIAEDIATALKNGSLILFPALFLAGLLTNLTPCVYPMIPITLNVMAQLGNAEGDSEQKRRRKRKLLPLFYVGAMIFVYSLLGVIAGMTGGVFGLQLSSPIFNGFMAAIMFLFGLSMLGVFNLSALQTLGNKIPLAKNNSAIAAATMGAVSGLIAAPCTGPVLSTILVLIAQTKDPLAGFSHMLTFSLGLGLPYLFLGYFGQSFVKLPRFPSLMLFIKIFFASLMFALALYFLRGSLQKISALEFLWTPPPTMLGEVLTLVALAFFWLLAKYRSLKNILYIPLVCLVTLLSLWLTLWASQAFLKNTGTADFASMVSESPIKWETDMAQAEARAQAEKKPVLVDIWARWCAACLEMEHTIWQNTAIVDELNSKYVTLKLDYTTPSTELQKFVDKWGVKGLPAIIILPRGSNLQESPKKVFQGLITTQQLRQAIGEDAS